MRIAIVTEVFTPKVDGVVTRLLNTIEQLSQLGHEVLVVAPEFPAPDAQTAGHNPSPVWTPPPGLQVCRVPSLSFRPLYPEVRVGLPSWRAARALKAFRPDVVHLVNPVATGAFGASLAVCHRWPILASYHTDLGEYVRKLGVGWGHGLITRWTAAIHARAQVNLCPSMPLVERARRAGMPRVDLWPKAVDSVRFHPGCASGEMCSRLSDGHPDNFLLLSAGRVSNEKDLIDLVQPMRQFADQEPNKPGQPNKAQQPRKPQKAVRLAIVGDGPARQQLQRAFAGLNVVFTGYLAGGELAGAYASADAFVFPSTTETLGFAAMESMASGVPVIGARAGGLPDVIHDGIDGYLVAPHDSQAMVQRIRQLADDSALRARLGAAARSEAEKCSWRNATSRLVELYCVAISRKGLAQ